MTARNEQQDESVWWELVARPQPGVATEVAAQILRERAWQGVAITDRGLTAYFLARDAARSAAAAVAPWCGSSEVQPVQAANWSNWREAFQPVGAGERLRVYPPWLAPTPAILGAVQPGSAELPVVIEPGLAFGTGDHPTTAACLAYLERSVRRGQTVLDVGTGSGVLAIAAALLGAGRVVAIDLDPIACRAARENLARNPAVIGRVEILEQDAAALGGIAADLVVANLTSALLTSLASLLAGLVRPSGALVVSGMSSEQAPAVTAAFAAAGLRAWSRTLERGWATILLRGGPPGAGAGTGAGERSPAC